MSNDQSASERLLANQNYKNIEKSNTLLFTNKKQGNIIADDLHSVDGAFMSNLSDLNAVGFKT